MRAGVQPLWVNRFHLFMSKWKCCLHFLLADTCSKSYATSLSSNPHTSQMHSFSFPAPLMPTQFSAPPKAPTEHTH